MQVVEICSQVITGGSGLRFWLRDVSELRHVRFHGFEAKCELGRGFMLEWDGVAGSGGSRGWGTTGGQPSVNAVLQTTVAAVVWDPLAVREMETVVDDFGVVHVNVLHGYGALANAMVGLRAEGTAIHALWYAKE